MGSIFQGKTFCLAGKLSIPHSTMKSRIESHGGRVTGSVSGNTTYLVTSAADDKATKVVLAKKHGVTIVAEDFITLSIANKNLGGQPSHHTGKRSAQEMSTADASPFSWTRRRPVPDCKKKLKMNAENIREKVEQVFHSFADAASPDEIGYDGMLKLCEQLQVQPTDTVMLIIAWKFNASTMCKFKKHEFVDGMIRLQCDTVDALRAQLPALRLSISTSQEQFKQFYNFAFKYSCPEGQKCLQKDVAIQMWRLLLDQRYDHLELWLRFIQEKHNRAITRDTWNLFLEFTTSVKSFDNFEDGEAWPVLIDDFVEFAREV